jgi:hypothetical protein
MTRLQEIYREKDCSRLKEFRYERRECRDHKITINMGVKLTVPTRRSWITQSAIDQDHRPAAGRARSPVDRIFQCATTGDLLKVTLRGAKMRILTA